jgi:hypothetical protein
MVKYLENSYGIESLEVIDFIIQDIESDEDNEYRLLMGMDGGDQEVYSTSAYEQNLHDTKGMLETKFNLVKIKDCSLCHNTGYLDTHGSVYHDAPMEKCKCGRAD